MSFVTVYDVTLNVFYLSRIRGGCGCCVGSTRENESEHRSWGRPARPTCPATATLGALQTVQRQRAAGQCYSPAGRRRAHEPVADDREAERMALTPDDPLPTLRGTPGPEVKADC